MRSILVICAMILVPSIALAQAKLPPGAVPLGGGEQGAATMQKKNQPRGHFGEQGQTTTEPAAPEVTTMSGEPVEGVTPPTYQDPNYKSDLPPGWEPEPQLKPGEIPLQDLSDKNWKPAPAGGSEIDVEEKVPGKDVKVEKKKKRSVPKANPW